MWSLKILCPLAALSEEVNSMQTEPSKDTVRRDLGKDGEYLCKFQPDWFCSDRPLLVQVRGMEKAMSFIAAEVKKKSYDELSHLRLVAKPYPEGYQNNALFL